MINYINYGNTKSIDNFLTCDPFQQTDKHKCVNFGREKHLFLHFPFKHDDTEVFIYLVRDTMSVT
jgi:hypothetical protein